MIENFQNKLNISIPLSGNNNSTNGILREIELDYTCKVDMPENYGLDKTNTCLVEVTKWGVTSLSNDVCKENFCSKLMRFMNNVLGNFKVDELTINSLVKRDVINDGKRIVLCEDVVHDVKKSKKVQKNKGKTK